MSYKNKTREKLQQKISSQQKTNIHDELLTDKFCMLFCCKSFYNVCITKELSCVKILHETNIGKRYLIKFNTQNKNMSEKYRDILMNNNSEHLITDAKTQKDKVNHFGILLCEINPTCRNVCSENTLINSQHKNENRSVPNLQIVDKRICDILSCECQKEDCPSKKNCDILFPFLLHCRSKLFELQMKYSTFDEMSCSVKEPSNSAFIKNILPHMVEHKFETLEVKNAKIKFQQLIDKYNIPNDKLNGNIRFDNGMLLVDPILSDCFGNLKKLSEEKQKIAIKDYLDFIHSFITICDVTDSEGDE